MSSLVNSYLESKCDGVYRFSKPQLHHYLVSWL